ncbi:hypothetical protein ACPUVO_13885 [Pseudocolwellia sp. HL-MZ19]|uniref:hypothetical protein n=1 Tax=Pseudocolwellia sp. HL-MZ19 TaxID=3400846 RepID=UPI003CF5ABA2
MNIDTSPFEAPKSDLTINVKEELYPTFSNLNFWRKLYLCLMWFFTAFFFIGVVVNFTILAAGSGENLMAQVFLSFFLAGFTYWNHTAIVKRKLKQITILTIINIVPFINIIGALIMLSIRRVTKKELEMYDVKK